jgi:ankyrin repeat protein
MNAMINCILKPGIDDNSYTRLHKCVLGLTLESVEATARGSRSYINETDSIGRTALYWAAFIGDAKTIEILLRCGACPCVADGNGITPLHTAAGLGSVTCVRH